jgi:cbb3-type cytochrome oxidase subunit 3
MFCRIANGCSGLKMIFDFLTILFFIAGILLIYRMVRRRRRDVLQIAARSDDATR